jgi:hypothetical protein
MDRRKKKQAPISKEHRSGYSPFWGSRMDFSAAWSASSCVDGQFIMTEDPLSVPRGGLLM